MRTTVRELPPIDTWSDNQRRGADCVFGGERLRAEDLIDLRERRDVDGTLVFPRACSHHADGGAV